MAILIVVAALASGVPAEGGDSGETVVPAQGAPGSESNPNGPAEIVIPERYGAQPGSRTTQAGTTIVWLTPQDEDTSTTVIFTTPATWPARSRSRLSNWTEPSTSTPMWWFQRTS